MVGLFFISVFIWSGRQVRFPYISRHDLFYRIIPMFHSQPVYFTNTGEVFLSECGQCFIVIFNNIVLKLLVNVLLLYFKNIENCHYSIKGDSDQETRDIVFSTFSNCMILCFSVTEIAELYYLLQSALIEAKIYV